MKVLTLKLNDKIYTTGKITAYISKQALQIQKEAIALGKLGKELENDEGIGDNLDKIDGLLDALMELKNRKGWLIKEVYGNVFTVDDIEKNLDDDEIDAEINRIIYGIAGVVSKN
jgi:hypothetical protein